MNYVVISRWTPGPKDPPNPHRRVAKYQAFDTQEEADEFRESISSDYPDAFVVANPAGTEDFTKNWRVNAAGNALEAKGQAEIDEEVAAEDSRIDELINSFSADRKTIKATILTLFDMINALRTDPAINKPEVTINQLRSTIKSRRDT